MPGYLPEGFTESGYIAARERSYEAVKFRYRALSLAERFACEEAYRSKKPTDSAKVTFSILEKKIVEWDLRAKEDDDSPLPINQETMARLNPSLALRLYNVVAGYDTGDADPSEQAADKDETEALFESLLTGKSVGEAKAEADAKN